MKFIKLYEAFIRKRHCIFLLFLGIVSYGCNENGNNKNLLYGIIFRNIKTIPEMKDYKDLGGGVIGETNNSGNYNYCIQHLKGDKNDVIIFEQILFLTDKQKPDYKILDTINVNNINDSLEVEWGICQQDTILHSEIIALVYTDYEKPFFDRVIKAWKVDFKQEKIIPIDNAKGIDCINEGDPGCPDEDPDKE